MVGLTAAVILRVTVTFLSLKIKKSKISPGFLEKCLFYSFFSKILLKMFFHKYHSGSILLYYRSLYDNSWLQRPCRTSLVWYKLWHNTFVFMTQKRRKMMLQENKIHAWKQKMIYFCLFCFCTIVFGVFKIYLFL